MDRLTFESFIYTAYEHFYVVLDMLVLGEGSVQSLAHGKVMVPTGCVNGNGYILTRLSCEKRSIFFLVGGAN